MLEGIIQLSRVNWFARIEDERVFTNLGVRFGYLGIGYENFNCHSLKQVHGTDIVAAGLPTAATSVHHPHADGLYTQESGVVVGIKTADCLPVLLTNKSRSTVMALHAGWKGLTAGMLSKGLAEFRRLQSDQVVFASIGPSIGPCHYEVGPELVERLCEEKLGLNSEQVGFCLNHGARDRWFLDLASSAVFALLNQSISPENISVFRSCTYCNSELWHSFRRDGMTAPLRNWSWIAAS